MCKVKVDNIREGLMPSEKVVRIPSATGGFEELSVSARQVQHDAIEAAEICRDEGNVLVELPRETAAGRWRVWVHEDRVMK